MDNNHDVRLKPYLSPVNAWAFSLGTSIGWGSLVITSTNYLSNSGPLGSVLGMAVGTIIMLIIARSYFYMMMRYPDAGGAYMFAKHAFGYDQGFLTAWFLVLTYFSILWANATSLPLFARYFIGDFFKFGKLYELFGYEVYLGEALLSIAALILTAILMINSRKLTAWIMTALVMIFFVGIIVCFAAAIFGLNVSLSPAFQPNSNEITQVVKIAFMSTWAFIGFENISHASEEFNFKHTKSLGVLRISVITTSLLYICVTLLSVTAYPPQYSSWLEYISDIGNLEGISALPAFYAAQHYLGDAGLVILMASLLALIITSLIGNSLALSRLFFSLARDRIMPSGFASLNKRKIPWKTIVLIAGVSCVVIFVGRVAIGWIVDVTTLGATLIYGIVAATAMKTAKQNGDKYVERISLAGLIIMIGFMLYLLLPNLFWESSLENESYIMFISWSLIGIAVFRILLKHDSAQRFGHTLVVWMALLSLTLFISLVWMTQSAIDSAESALNNVYDYYVNLGMNLGDTSFIAEEINMIKRSDTINLGVVIGSFGLVIALLINNYSIMSKRARKSEAELGEVKTVAFNDSLTSVKSKHAYVDFERNINDAIKSGESEPFAVTVCDVNGLKQINDTLGHKAGDQYIQDAAKIISDIYKHSPVFRVGGDEFVVLMKGHDFEHRDELYNIMTERNSLIKPGQGVVIAAGMSDFDAETDIALADVFARADGYMYENKKMLKTAAK